MEERSIENIEIIAHREKKGDCIKEHVGSIYISNIGGIGAPEGEEREKMGQKKIRSNLDLEFSKIALKINSQIQKALQSPRRRD